MKKYLCFMLIALIALASFVSCEAEPEHVHDMKKVEAKPATCTEDGYEAYEECECGYKTEIVVIPAGHELEDVAGLESTCTEAGYTAHKACQNCDYTEGKEVVPASHEYDAVCTEGHTICSGCGGIDPEETIDNYEAKQSDWSFVDGKTVLTASCGCATENFTVIIGSVGPAGGYIFYDCDADNAEEENDGLVSSVCGWRYLEGAPTAIQYDSTAKKYYIGEENVPLFTDSLFGYYMPDVAFNDDKTLKSGTLSSINTEDGIGKGKSNTEKLVGEKAYILNGDKIDISKKTTQFSALICSNLEYTVNGNTFDDWFCPSAAEIHTYLTEIFAKGKTDAILDLEEKNIKRIYATSSEASKGKVKYVDTKKDTNAVSSINDTGISVGKRANKDLYTIPVRSF